MRNKVITGVVLTTSGLLILALFTANFWVPHTKDYLLAKAERSLGRKISADRVEVTLSSFGVRLVNVTLFDDSAVSAKELLRAKSMQFDLQFLPLLIGQFRARKLALDSPVITIAHDENGSNNAGPDAKKRHRKAGDNNRPPAAEKQDSPRFFLVAPLKVSNGTLRYRDLRTGRELTVSQIDLRIDGSTSDQPYEVELEAAVMTAKTNVKLKGSFGPVAAAGDYRDVPIDGNLQVEALDMGSINNALPQWKKALPRVLQFDGIYSTKDLKFKGSLNHLSLKGAVTGTDASVRFE